MEDDEELQEGEIMSPFRTLLHRAISFLRREEEKLEQEMIDRAIENSMDTYQNSLFSVDVKRKISINPSILDEDVEEECHLCLDFMKKGDNVIVLPCQHIFHSQCVEELIVHQHIVCPLCRKSIPVEKLE